MVYHREQTTGCFSQPGKLQFGNLGLDPIYGPGYWNLDGSLFRSFQVTERFKMELRAEAFSAVNTPIWGNPDTGFGKDVRLHRQCRRQPHHAARRQAELLKAALP